MQEQGQDTGRATGAFLDPALTMPGTVRVRLPALTIGLSVAIVVVTMLLPVAVAVALAAVFGESGVVLELSYIVGMALGLIAALRIRGMKLSWQAFDPQPLGLKLLAALCLATLVLDFLVAPLHQLVPVSQEDLEWLTDMTSQGGFLAFFTLVIAAPLLEELIFRGVILDGLLRRYSPRVAIVASGLLFGAVHMNWIQFVSAGSFGLLAGWVYYRSRSLGTCVVMHAAANGIVYWVQQLARPEELLEEAMTETETSLSSYLGPAFFNGLVLLVLLRVVARGLDRRRRPDWRPAVVRS